MNITINDDLTSQITDDELTVECNLPNYNPETLRPWASSVDVQAFIEAKVIGYPNYFMPYVSPEDKEQLRLDVKADEVRTQRNKLLAESDWTQVADANVDQTAWATYRQSLRDVPAQEGFPDDVTWPEQPGA
jgi:hypothetical protein